jgi:RNA polymerase sigma-70 factor, ECF subfamily
MRGDAMSLAADANAATMAAVALHQGMVWRYLRMIGADAHEADDCMQDAFVTFAEALRNGTAVHAPAAFLRGIARNLLLATRRREAKAPPEVAWLDAVDQLVAAEPSAFSDRRLDALRRCLERLGDRARQAIEAHHLHGMSRRELATQLGIGDEGAKSLLSRARDLLRDCVQQRLAEENEA